MNKKANSRPILIALDTETQLVRDDSVTQNKIEEFKRDLKLLELESIFDHKTRKKYLQEKKRIEKRIKLIEPLLCNEIQTYALAWQQVKNVSSEKRFYKDIFKRHKDHTGDIWKCETCLDLFAKCVNVVLNVDNTVNVWISAFDDMIKKYPKTKKDHEYYLKIYIHNLKFDARSLEYTIINNKRLFENVETVVTDNRYYLFRFEYRGHVIELVDSFKLLSFPLSSVGRMVGLSKKTELASYEWFDLKHDSEKLENEIKYLCFDVLVLMQGIKFIKKTMGVKSLTTAGFAKKEMKQQLYKDDSYFTTENYQKIFNSGFTKDLDDYIRGSYYGGMCMVLPKRDNKVYNLGFSADCNSMYPAAMLEKYPDPTSLFTINDKECKQYFELYKNDPTKKVFNIYRVAIYSMQLKNNGIPIFPKKNSRFNQLKSINNLSDMISDNSSSYICTLNNIDLLMICNEYDLEFEFIDGIAAREILTEPFKNFVNIHKKEKEQATIIKDLERKFVAKVSLNSSYGKLAEQFHELQEYLCKDDNGDPFYEKIETGKEWKQKGNILIASFITSYARKNLYTQSKKIKSSPIASLNYVDTDSVHFSYNGKYLNDLQEISKQIRNKERYDKQALDSIFRNVCKELDIEYSESEFGKWKIEGFFDKAVYLDAKRYIEYDLMEGDNVKIAGVQAVGRKYVLEKGLDFFRYTNEHIIVVPFTQVRAVKNGYKFVNTYKFLTPERSKLGYIEF